MKRLIIALLLIVAMALTVQRVAAYDFEQAYRYLWQAAEAEVRVLRAENRILKPLAETAPVLIERNAELEAELDQVKEELAEASKLAALVTNAGNLKAQIAGLHDRVGSTRATLSQARAELGRVLRATTNINTAMGEVGARQFVCCGSMEPAITGRDLVFILKDPTSVRRGDIVIAPCPPSGFSVIHRVVGGDASGYILKGDANKSPDPCRPTLDEITWKVVAIARKVYWEGG